MDNLFVKNKLRSELRKPLGKVVENVLEYVEKNLKGRLIVVGDVSYKKLKKLRPKLSIIDFHTRRTEWLPKVKCDFSLFNPPGSITKEAWNLIKFSLESSKNKKIKVVGEEDLLVLPSILLADEGDMVVYGLDGRFVVVEVSSITKKLANYFIRNMKKGKFSNVVAAGTFDRFHRGHRYFLKLASFYGRCVHIGITSNEMARKKSNLIQEFEIRRAHVNSFMKHLRVKFKLYEINDIYGFCITNPKLDAIVATPETLKNVEKINTKRIELGMKELNVFVIPYLLDKRGEKISSRKLRKILRDYGTRGSSRQTRSKCPDEPL